MSGIWCASSLSNLDNEGQYKVLSWSCWPRRLMTCSHRWGFQSPDQHELGKRNLITHITDNFEIGGFFLISDYVFL